MAVPPAANAARSSVSGARRSSPPDQVGEGDRVRAVHALRRAPGHAQDPVGQEGTGALLAVQPGQAPGQAAPARPGEKLGPQGLGRRRGRGRRHPAGGHGVLEAVPGEQRGPAGVGQRAEVVELARGAAQARVGGVEPAPGGPGEWPARAEHGPGHGLGRGAAEREEGGGEVGRGDGVARGGEEGRAGPDQGVVVEVRVGQPRPRDGVRPERGPRPPAGAPRGGPRSPRGAPRPARRRGRTRTRRGGPRRGRPPPGPSR